MNKNRDSKLFDLSYTTSKISTLIDRIRGYRNEEEYEEPELDPENSTRWENLKQKLSDHGDFQAAEDSEIKSVEEKLGQQFDRDEDDN